MKKSFCISLLVISAVVFTGCNKDKVATPTFIVEDETSFIQTLSADQTDGKAVAFTTSGAWTSEIQYSEGQRGWISLNPGNGGTTAGKYTLNATLEKNYSGQSRSAEIIITCNGEKITMKVTQEEFTTDGAWNAPSGLSNKECINILNNAGAYLNTGKFTGKVTGKFTTNTSTTIYDGQTEYDPDAKKLLYIEYETVNNNRKLDYFSFRNGQTEYIYSGVNKYIYIYSSPFVYNPFEFDEYTWSVKEGKIIGVITDEWDENGIHNESTEKITVTFDKNKHFRDMQETYEKKESGVQVSVSEFTTTFIYGTANPNFPKGFSEADFAGITPHYESTSSATAPLKSSALLRNTKSAKYPKGSGILK